MSYPKIIVVSIFTAIFLGAAITMGVYLDQAIYEFVFSVSGFIQNPFYFIYLITAAVFIFHILLSEKKLAHYMLLIGKFYIFISFIGFIIFGPQTIGSIVSVLNLGLGVISIATGMMLLEYRQLLLVAEIISKRRETSCTVTTLIKNGGFNKATKFRLEQIPAS